MNNQTTNEIIQLVNSKQILGRIDEYNIGDSAVWIRVNSNNGFLFYLYFYDVKYLSGLTGLWIGVNLTVADNLVCQNLFMSLGFPNEVASYMTQHFKLFEAKNDNNLTLQIVAAGVSKVEDDILAIKLKS